MAHYVILFRFTQQGIANLKESPERVAQIKQQFREAGAEVKAFYALLGRYDTVFVAEAPDDETIARLVAAIAMKGNVQAETLRAFTEEEFRRIVSALPLEKMLAHPGRRLGHELAAPESNSIEDFKGCATMNPRNGRRDRPGCPPLGRRQVTALQGVSVDRTSKGQRRQKHLRGRSAAGSPGSVRATIVPGPSVPETLAV
jgi:uncharacterized protein with GYD domain